MSRLFGTDGIRGIVNQWPLTPEFVLKFGQAVAQVIDRGNTKPVVIIGRDPRQSGHMLENALAAGLMSQGVDVKATGITTTPGVAYLTRKHRAQMGIVISASHNRFDHNGIKIFGADGFKIPDETEMEIERLTLDTSASFKEVAAEQLGRSWDTSDWQQDYVDFLADVWGEGRRLHGRRVILDCANGATASIAPEVFRRLGADVVVRENEPDGFNINARYEYIWPESLRAAVLEQGGDVGIAFDGDGDRVMLVNEKGGYVNGDAMLAILARFMKQENLLTNNAVVSTPMSNWGLKASLEEVGIRLEETSVGDRFVLQRMIEENYALGGEQSGHILILRHGQTTGDGIYTALAVLKVIETTGRTLSELAACIQELPECLVNIDVPNKPPLHTIPEIQEALQRLKKALSDNIDITLRYSGTESKLRLKIRAGAEHEQARLEQEAAAFMAAAKQAIR